MKDNQAFELGLWFNGGYYAMHNGFEAKDKGYIWNKEHQYRLGIPIGAIIKLINETSTPPPSLPCEGNYSWGVAIVECKNGLNFITCIDGNYPMKLIENTQQMAINTCQGSSDGSSAYNPGPPP